MISNSGDVTGNFVQFLLSTTNNSGLSGVWLIAIAWLAGYSGFHWSLVFFIVLGLYACWRRQTRRLRRNIVWSLQSVLKEPEVARAVLGSDLPPWVLFSRVERSAWLQAIVDNMWPYCRTMLQETCVSKLDAALEILCPSFLRAIRVTFVDFGDSAPTIEGIETHVANNMTVLDVHVRWFGNLDIRLNCTSKMSSVEAVLSSLQASALVRVELGPHCNVWPFFRRVSLSLFGPPVIDLNIKASRIPLDTIPGLGNWLDSFVYESVLGMFVYPKKWTTCFVRDEDDVQEADIEPSGCIVMHIEKAENLPSTSLWGSSWTFVSVTSTMGDRSKEVTLRTKSVKGRSPIYDDEYVRRLSADRQKLVRKWFQWETYAGESEDAYSSEMQFPAYMVPNELLTIRVIRVSYLKKLMPTKEVLGVTEVRSASVLQHPCAATVPLMNPKNPLADVGVICFSARYCPFHADSSIDTATQKSLRARSSGPSPESKTVIAAPVDGIARLKHTKTVSNALPEGSHSVSQQQATILEDPGVHRIMNALSSLRYGIVIVHLINGSNLRATAPSGVADAFCIIRVGRRQVRSATVYGTTNPRWDCKFQLQVSDAATEALDIIVYDENKNAKMDKIGSIKVFLSEFAITPEFAPVRPRQLNTQGTLTFTLKLKLFG